MKSVEKILIIRFHFVSDVILSTILLENLRAFFPSARIDFLTADLSKEIVLSNPILNDVISIDPRVLKHPSPFKRILANLRFLRRVTNPKYDMVIDLYSSPKSAFMTWASKARIRVGWRTGLRSIVYTIKVKNRSKQVHQTQCYLDVLETLNIPIISRHLYIEVGKGSFHFAENLWNEYNLFNQRVIAINFSAGWPTREWPLDRFAHLADLLVSEYHAKIIILWAPGDFERARLLQDLISAESIVIPETNLKQLAAIIERSDILITGDSGAMHLATAMGTPNVALFGPTDPQLNGPFDKKSITIRDNKMDCLGCNKTSCKTLDCMNNISVKEVMVGVKKCIEKNQLFPSLTSA